MLGLNLNINTLFIFIIGYAVFIIIQNQFKNNKTENDINENFEEQIQRPTPKGDDKEDKRYKPVLTQPQNIKDICIKECLPYNINEIPEEKIYKEPTPGIDNLLGHNFLNSKYHSQVNKVGTFKGNKKVDIRPEIINPQVGVSPTTQSVINIDWPNDEQVLLAEQKYSDIWQRLL